MSKSLAELNKERMNHSAVREDFPVGTHVHIVCACRDFHFWYDETGIVVENKDTYLGIKVKLDEPREYDGGQIITHFGFRPQDLVVIKHPIKDLSVLLWEKLYKRIGD